MRRPQLIYKGYALYYTVWRDQPEMEATKALPERGCRTPLENITVTVAKCWKNGTRINLTAGKNDAYVGFTKIKTTSQKVVVMN